MRRGRGLGDRDLPRKHAERDGTGPAVRRVGDAAAVEVYRREVTTGLTRAARENDGAGEVGHECRGGPRRELARRSLLDDPAVAQDADPVAEQGGLGEVVRYKDDRYLERVERGYQLAARARPRRWVERRERLVEQEEIRLAGEGARERHALALAAGELRRLGVGQLGQAESIQQRERRGTALAARPVGPHAVGDVTPRAEVGEECVVLDDVAAAPALRRPADAAASVDPNVIAAADRSAVGPRDTREHPQDRALARARRPGQRKAPAGGDLEADLEVDRADGVGELSAQHDGSMLRRGPP